MSVRELHNDLTGYEGIGEGCLPEVRSAAGKLLANKGARDPDTGKPLIGENTLRKLLPPQLRRMTEKHKMMCGCKCCITMKGLHRSLERFRANLTKQLLSDAKTATGIAKEAATARANAYSPPQHATPRDAVECITCAPVEATAFVPWRCTLRRCPSCPKTKYRRRRRAPESRRPPSRTRSTPNSQAALRTVVSS